MWTYDAMRWRKVTRKDAVRSLSGSAISLRYDLKEFITMAHSA